MGGGLRMVSDAYMKQVLGALSSSPRTMRSLAQQLDKPQSRLRETLVAMQELGLVDQVDLPKEKGRGIARKGWVKR